MSEFRQRMGKRVKTRAIKTARKRARGSERGGGALEVVAHMEVRRIDRKIDSTGRPNATQVSSSPPLS